LVEREQQALEIEDQIAETKKVLNKLRYAIVSNYYKSSSSESQAQVQRDTQNNSIVPSGIKDFDQKPIHPSLKKLIGKKPVNYDEILQSTRTTRKAALEAKSTINEKFSKIKPKRCETITRPETITPQPKFETPEVVQLTSSRGRNHLKHTIIIGNTSQYISEQSSSSITHKWMCYLKAKSAVPIERLVKKVRFQLDSSYAPNDIIDVNSPPFQLTRRGYGEFPIKLLIFFKDEVNLKPVQFHHDLILDKKFSGHQTLGSETVSELWTRNFLTQDENEKRKNDADLIESEKRTNLLNDHDYCKLYDIDEKKDVKEKVKEKVENMKLERKMSTHGSISSLKVDHEVVDWVNCHKELLNLTSREEKPSFDINVDDLMENDDASKNFRIPGSLELESKFIEMSCNEIGIKYSAFDQSSKLILIKVLKKFVADVAEKAVSDGNSLTKSEIEESLKSRPEFDFLLRR
jgi:transcription initiation factor IIF auxiliary subunit